MKGQLPNKLKHIFFRMQPSGAFSLGLNLELSWHDVEWAWYLLWSIFSITKHTCTGDWSELSSQFIWHHYRLERDLHTLCFSAPCWSTAAAASPWRCSQPMTGGNFPSRDPADSGWGEHGGVNRKKKIRGGWIVINERLCMWACAGMWVRVCRYVRSIR